MARPIDPAKEDSYAALPLDPKKGPNRLTVDRVDNDNGNSIDIVAVSYPNTTESELFLGDTVMLEGNSCCETICIVAPDTILGSVGDAIKHDEEEINYDHIGFLQKQLAQIRGLLELPLRNPQVFQSISIEPPRGILLYGPSGTGITNE